MRRTTLAIAAFATAITLAGCSTPGSDDPVAEVDFPEDDITFIVPYPAGSGPDAAARVITAGLEQELGVSVIVENIEGGASTVGLYELQRSDPDGYTLGWGTGSGISVQSRLVDSPFGGIDAVTPIAQVNLVANVLFTSPNRGWETVEDMVEEARERPGELTVGLGNPGSIQDIQVRLLEEAADIDLKPVYFDAGQMILPAVNGTVDMAVAQVTPTVQYVQTGDLVYLGALGTNVPDSVDTPLISESGYDTSEADGWEGVFGPADMDEAVVKIISDAIGRVMESDDYLDYVEKVYAVAGYLPYDEFREVAEQGYANGASIIERFELDQQ